MSKPPLEAKFFTKVSYVKNEPRIAVVPVDMPNYEQTIAIGENPDGEFEGNISLVYETVEQLDIAVKQFRFESSVEITCAYERLQKTYPEFEKFLTDVICAVAEQRWSEFPMCFPVPNPVNRS